VQPLPETVILRGGGQRRQKLMQHMEEIYGNTTVNCARIKTKLYGANETSREIYKHSQHDSIKRQYNKLYDMEFSRGQRFAGERNTYHTR